MRRPAAVVGLVVALLLGAGAAHAVFTASRTTPQTFTAADGPPVAPVLTAMSRSNDGGASGSQIQFGLRLRNTGDGAVSLGSVTLRYWFTADRRTGPPVAACYFASYGCGKLTLGVTNLTIAREEADHFLQVGFTGGSLAPGAAADLDQLALRDPGGATFTQGNDHSFLPASAFTDNAHVTVYLEGSLVWGTEPVELPPVTDLEVEYANRDANPHDAAIMPTLLVRNTGTVPLDASLVTLRYWFTRDGGAGDLLAFCDYAEIGCGQVQTSFHPVDPARPGADSYLEVTFSGGVGGADSSTGQIQLRVHTSDYSPFDETDDHSHGSQSTLASWDRVTAYYDGQLVWGVEP